MSNNLISEKSFHFALQAIDVYKLLIKKNEFILSKQFLRSSTSIGANVQESLAGYSRKDFSAKMSIASKEARETLYWIKLIEYSNSIDYDFENLKSECERLIRILSSTVKTTQATL